MGKKHNWMEPKNNLEEEEGDHRLNKTLLMNDKSATKESCKRTPRKNGWLTYGSTEEGLGRNDTAARGIRLAHGGIFEHIS